MSCGGPHLRSATASFAAVAAGDYADNDLVANSTTAGLVTPLEFAIGTGDGRGIEIIGATLQKSGVGVTGATFELWLFSQAPTVTVGDNVAFSEATVDTAGYLGKLAFPAMAAFTDDARAMVYDNTDPMCIYLSGTSTIYGLIQTAAAYTDETAGETFTATLIYKQYA